MDEVTGETGLKSIRYRNTKTGEVTEYKDTDNKGFGVFVFAGYEPATDLVKDIAQLDDAGYIITDRSQKTNVEGLYAAGDVCVKSLRQVVTATGDGALAATELEKYAAAMQDKTGLHPAVPEALERASVKDEKPQTGNEQSGLFSKDMISQLNGVFSKMERALVLKLYLDSGEASRELEGYMTALAELTDKLSVEKTEATDGDGAPFVSICLEDGTSTGLGFHGVPGGHEFTSFVLGLYNAAGPGQAIDDDIRRRIEEISEPVKFTIMVSLSCTMCPELVIAAQKIAAENVNVTAEIFDLNHFPDMKDKYNVMSVPCMVINDSKVSFGKKNIQQILDLL